MAILPKMCHNISVVQKIILTVNFYGSTQVPTGVWGLVMLDAVVMKVKPCWHAEVTESASEWGSETGLHLMGKIVSKFYTVKGVWSLVISSQSGRCHLKMHCRIWELLFVQSQQRGQRLIGYGDCSALSSSKSFSHMLSVWLWANYLIYSVSYFPHL